MHLLIQKYKWFRVKVFSTYTNMWRNWNWPMSHLLRNRFMNTHEFDYERGEMSLGINHLELILIHSFSHSTNYFQIPNKSVISVLILFLFELCFFSSFCCLFLFFLLPTHIILKVFYWGEKFTKELAWWQG